MSGGRVAVIGAAGAIGTRFVERLALSGQGHRVIAIVRRWSSAVALARYDVELRCADVETGAEAIREAISGAEAVVDLTYPKQSDAPKRRERLAAVMASAVAGAAHAAGARRLVHLGSISSYGALAQPIHHEGAPSRPSRDDGYGRAKLAATKTALEMASRVGLETIVLEPTVVYGPGTGWSTGTLAQLRSGRIVLPEPGNGNCPAVYLDDVCRAIETAIAAGAEACGRRYLVSGAEEVPWHDFFAAHGEIAASREGGWTMTRSAAELARRRSQARRLAGPFRRMFALFRQDAAVRGAVLSLPGPAQARRIARSALSESGWQRLRGRLVAPAEGAGGGRGTVEFDPAPVQESLFGWRGRIDDSQARERLRFCPEVPFAVGMEMTAAWARWAGLGARAEGHGR